MAFYIFCIFLYEIEKEIDYKKYIPNNLFFPQEVLLFIIVSPWHLFCHQKY